MSATIQSGASTDLLTIDPTSKAARAWLYDPAGNPIESVLDNGNHYLGVSARQDVHPSTSNSSTVNLGAGASFAGVPESTLGVAGIQVNTYVDRPHTVQVFQGKDAGSLRLMPGGTYTVPANTSMVRTFQATSSFWQVVVTNNGASPSTVTDINCALCPVVDAVPPALTSGGSLSVTPTAEWQANGLVTGIYAYSSFRTLGSAASPQNVFAINNPVGNTKYIAVRQLVMIVSSTVAQLTISQQILTSKPAALPTGGTALTPVKRRSLYAAASAVVLGATASDGGGATAITATPGTTEWQQFMDRQATAVGLITHPQYSLLPDVGADLRQDVLAPGESILVQVTGSVPATTNMIVNASTTEYLAL